MEGYGEHILARIENILRTVSVMIVDIEDRDFRGALRQSPRGADRSIVQIRVSAHIIGSRMVAGWSAKRKGRRRTTQDML